MPHLPSPRLFGRALVLVAVASALVFGYFWLRGSSLMEVRSAEVVGVSGYRAAEIRSRLERAAHGQPTMNVDIAALREAVDQYPTVRSISVDGRPPHGITINVEEDRPVAVLVHGARRIPVAADGRTLAGVPATGVPLVLTRGEIRDGAPVSKETKLVLAAISAAPADLRKQVQLAGVGRDSGLTLQLESGVALRFGDGQRLRAKWLAAAGVLGDPQAAEATYIDLRAPERPAAGGLEPTSELTAPMAPAAGTR